MEFIQVSGVASVLLAAISMSIAARIMGAAAPEAGAAERVLRYTGSVLLAVGALGACLVTMGWFGFLGWPVVMVIWFRAAINYRATQKRNLLSALTVAIEKRMPLAPMAVAFATEQERGFARRAQALADDLEQGMPVANALALSGRALPPESPLAAAIGLETGDLAAALDATTYASVFERAWLQPMISRLAYLLVVLLVFVSILVFMQLKIAPSMVAIFSDFQISGSPIGIDIGGLSQPPPMPKSLIDWLSFQVPMAWIGSVVAAGWLVTLSLGAGLICSLVFVYGWLQWRGTLRPRLPGLRRIINWVDMGPILRVLALASERQRSMVSLVVAMARLHPKRSVRARMRRVVRDMDNGIPWYEGLRRRGMITRNDAAILAAAGRGQHMSWAMKEMAASFERKASYRLQALAQSVVPLLLVPLGLATAVVALSYFTPLTRLIEHMS
ncbi:MAG: type II secretion system F family protein [Pirellulales bacterium]